MYSCENNDHKENIEPVSDVECTSFIGSLILSWIPPADSDYYYTQILYYDSNGKNIGKKVSRFNLGVDNRASVTVGGFTDTNEYEFVLIAYGYEGNKSSPVTVKGKPLSIEKAKDYVIEAIEIEAFEDGAKILWTNETAVGVDLVVTYIDRNNISQEIKIDATHTGSYVIRSFIEKTEVAIYAVNHLDGGKSIERRYMITPTIDPDDIIYGDVDYITFGSGTNDIDFTQNNPENPYEYTFVTKGGDPYINCNGLKKAIKGRTLMFRYKSTGSFDLELFWCDAGGGAAGGRSTVVVVPENNSEEWRTFRYNYADAMTANSWMGKVGDFARFDWGGRSGVTIHVKNIHFE